MVQAMALLARGRALDDAEAKQAEAQLVRGRAGVEAFVDQLLADPAVGAVVAPRLTVQHMTSFVGHTSRLHGYVLKTAKSEREGEQIFYLREPCTAAEAERVRPWWALDTEVLVCPDAHRPTVFRAGPSQRNGAAVRCYSQGADPLFEAAPTCGCGPNLVRCHPSHAHWLAVQRSLANEVSQTVAYVVNQDMPLEELWTSNATFRDRNAEFVYRHASIEEGRGADLEALADWPERGQWAPRVELVDGQHAGLATTQQFMGYSADMRTRMSNVNEKMWCVPTDSAGATAAEVLAIPSHDHQRTFWREDWEYLSRRTLCTNCHARLDHGVRFFMGYPDGRGIASTFVPSLQLEGEGEMYLRDIEDSRGKAKLNPRAFAALAIKQPEFAACMVDNVAAHVFGNAPAREDRAALEDAFSQRPTFKSLMRAALIRYASSGRDAAARDEHPRTADAFAPPARIERAGVSLPADVRASIDDRCMHCHDGADEDAVPPDLRGAALPQGLLRQMIEEIGYGRMPKERGDGRKLADEERTALLSELVPLAYDAPDERRAAWTHLTNGQRGIQAPSLALALAAVREIATGEHPGGVPPAPPVSALEFMVRPAAVHYGPGFVSATALVALDTCRESTAAPAELEACVLRATRPAALSADKRTAPTRAAR